jgi:hypothetical protein
MDVGAVLLLAGLTVAALLDVRTREVPDRLWQVLGLVGASGGAVVLAAGGSIALALWLLVAALALEHMFPWDANGESWLGRWADHLDLLAYVGVVAVVAVSALAFGVGPSGVPTAAVALLVTIILARLLFEGGVLYGGADAKALMIAGVLVPLFPLPWLGVPAGAVLVTTFLPFAVNVVMDAALLSVVIPIGVALLNLRRGEFSVRSGFTTYTIPVEELPDRFVWVRDPDHPVDRSEEDEIETSEEDRAWRRKIAHELTAKGVRRVRVGPQLPFLVFLAVGALGALLVGNWVVDLLALA